jgi:signal transduction histidine kinase
MMRNLMLDLLDLAQMENKSFKINEEFFNLHEVIENSIRVIKHYAEKKSVKLIYP